MDDIYSNVYLWMMHYIVCMVGSGDRILLIGGGGSGTLVAVLSTVVIVEIVGED